MPNIQLINLRIKPQHAHLLWAMSLLVTRMVTGPDLMVLKMEMASECDMPWTDIPLTDRISSP